MLGLVLIYFLGKYFYNLAEEHNRPPWGYAILGVASYYGGSFIFGIIIVLIMEWNSPGSIDNMSDLALGLISMPFGLLVAAGVYKLLEKRFIAQASGVKNMNPDILDDDFVD